MKLTKIIKFWLPPVFWAVVIFSFSSYPALRASPIYWKDFFIKKTAHIIEYAILAILLYRAFLNYGKGKKKAAIYSILIVFAYGATDEFHQSFTPGREPRIRDVAIDVVGGALGIFILWNLLSKAPKSIRNLAEKLELV